MIAFGLSGAGDLVAGHGGLAVEVPAGWAQGRTAYGGWSAALALAAARWLGAGEGAEPIPPLRSAMINFIGPVSGLVAARPRLLRRGRNAAWIAVEIVDPGTEAVLVSAMFVFMRHLDSAVAVSDHPAPECIVPPEQAPPRQPMVDDPAFLARFESRHNGAASALGRSEHNRWVRLADRAGADPAAELLAITDFLLPGAVNGLGHRVPLSSMTWQVNFTGQAKPDPAGWWLVGAHALHAAHGISTEQITVWDRSGHPAAIAQQAVAVFG